MNNTIDVKNINTEEYDMKALKDAVAIAYAGIAFGVNAIAVKGITETLNKETDEQIIERALKVKVDIDKYKKQKTL